jgi:hypothetical protein
MSAGAEDAAHDIAMLNAAIADQGDNYGLLTSRGIIYWKSNQATLAEQDFAAAKPMEHNTICWELATAGIELTIALQECDAALVQAPDSAPYQDSRAGSDHRDRSHRMPTIRAQSHLRQRHDPALGMELALRSPWLRLSMS